MFISYRIFNEAPIYYRKKIQIYFFWIIHLIKKFQVHDTFFSHFYHFWKYYHDNFKKRLLRLHKEILLQKCMAIVRVLPSCTLTWAVVMKKTIVSKSGAIIWKSTLKIVHLEFPIYIGIFRKTFMSWIF